MARGRYIGKSSGELPIELQTTIPARATRRLQEESCKKIDSKNALTLAVREISPKDQEQVGLTLQSLRPANTIGPAKLLLLPQHRHLLRWIMCIICGVLFLSVLLSAAINLRPQGPASLSFSGSRTYSVQVGGNLAGSWQKDQPMVPKNIISSQVGPYSVLGKPSISVDFINQVLTAYHSPAAGKGQALYDLGVKYGIDPAYALAFFMHESSFGTRGEATESLSLGNLRCIPNVRCQDDYAWFDSWEDGFKAWYQLIRNLYVAQWGLSTVDQIIPRYAPAADHNDEAAYIAAIKHTVDTWHANVIWIQ
jgi:hypothetical protein